MPSMEMTLGSKQLIVAVIALPLLIGCGAHHSPPVSAADAAAVNTFNSRVAAYDRLRQDAERAVGALHTTAQAAELSQQEHKLAAEIRRARANATRGDIFSPDVEAFFRAAVARVTSSDGGADRVDAIRDAQPAAIALQVNAEYPDTKPLSTVPADVLKALPKLPRGIQYRFVPKYLLLYDARADLMIDYMPISLLAGA